VHGAREGRRHQVVEDAPDRGNVGSDPADPHAWIAGGQARAAAACLRSAAAAVDSHGKS
jgi:hypothetical protein